jgi:hypothetical protein
MLPTRCLALAGLLALATMEADGAAPAVAPVAPAPQGKMLTGLVLKHHIKGDQSILTVRAGSSIVSFHAGKDTRFYLGPNKPVVAGPEKGQGEGGEQVTIRAVHRGQQVLIRHTGRHANVVRIVAQGNAGTTAGKGKGKGTGKGPKPKQK